VTYHIHCKILMALNLLLLGAESYSKLLAKEKHLEEADTSNVETEAEVELTATGRPKRHAVFVLCKYICSSELLLQSIIVVNCFFVCCLCFDTFLFHCS